MSKNSQFEKFINKTKGSAIKEQIKQDRKLAKKQRAEAIDKRFEEKRKLKAAKGSIPRVENRSPTDNKSASAAKQGSPAPHGNLPEMPLNKYIAHSGICSRRDAADIVKKGDVTVNGEISREPGMKITEKDIVKVKGKKITPSRDFVYILLNKPKDFITTTEDPQGRKTVLDLIRNATQERVYPIGRLDRNTSGVLLFTNDGDLSQSLSHPKNEIKKIYEVKLDKPLSKNDFDNLLKGITLEDGFIAPDALAYADSKDKTIIGIEIHSGRNRVVRRMFEKLGYDVKGLDRVMYAGLTKKNVLRGKWRLLNEREIRILKHFNKGAVKNS
jgi:23S rRNA pseudouridine2605 synthase